MLDELDSVGTDTLNGADLGDNAGGYLSTALIAHGDRGTHWQLTIQVHGGPVLVQVRGLGFDRKGMFMQVFAGYAHWGVQSHASAAALRDATP